MEKNDSAGVLLNQQMRVIVEFFDGEPYEPLNLNMEQWRLVTGPILVAHSRTQSLYGDIPNLNVERNLTKLHEIEKLEEI